MREPMEILDDLVFERFAEKGNKPMKKITRALLEEVWNAAVERCAEECVFGDVESVEPVMPVLETDNERQKKQCHAAILQLRVS